MRRRPKSDWGEVFSVRAEFLVRPTPAFARHWLGFLGSTIRPITILLFVLVPQTLIWGPDMYFPERFVVELHDGRSLEVLERRVYDDYFTFQYLSDIELEDRATLERYAEELLATYVGPEAVEESCAWIELIPTEWCEHGFCFWKGVHFVARRTDDDTWTIVETNDVEQ